MNLKLDGGQGGIRTLGNLNDYASLAGTWFKPTHPPVQKSIFQIKNLKTRRNCSKKILNFA